MEMPSSADKLRLAGVLWGWEPHGGGQREWFCDESGVRVACCGRQWGKSQASAADIVTHALLSPGSLQCVVAPSLDGLEPIFNDICMLLENPRIPLPRDKAPLIRRGRDMDISLGPRSKKSSSFIDTMTVDVQTGGARRRGKHFDRIFVDEAANIEKDVIEQVFEPMLLRSGGQEVLISTPNGQNWFYDRCFVTWAATGVPHHHPSWDNPYLDRDFLERKKVELGETSFAWQQEYCAQFIAPNRQYFHIPFINRAMRGQAPSGVKRDGRVYAAGVDFAGTGDWTVVMVLDVTDDVAECVYMDRFHKLDRDDSNYWGASIRRISDTLEYWDARALVDATNMGDVAYGWLRDMNSRVEPYYFNHWESKRALLDALFKKFDKDEIVLFPATCQEGQIVEDEMKHFYVKNTESHVKRYEAGKGHHDDCIIALALAVGVSSQFKAPPEEEELSWSEYIEAWHQSKLRFPNPNDRTAVQRVPGNVW
mgnify:CR=1 FL=1